MNAGDTVLMSHPDGYATITGSGGRFVGWVPNGVRGTIYLFTPDRQSAVVNFDGKLIATISVANLRATGESRAIDPAA